MKRYLILAVLCVVCAPVFVAGQTEEATVPPAEQASERYDIFIHYYMKNNVEREAYCKFDYRTGGTWKLDGAESLTWQRILEPEKGKKPVPATWNRYVVYCHDFSKDGSEHQVYLRLDKKTGTTWVWSGNEKAWTEVSLQK